MDVKSIVAEALELPEGTVSDRDGVDSLQNWDSLATIRIAVALEEAFGLLLSTEDILELNSVEAAKALVRKHSKGT